MTLRTAIENPAAVLSDAATARRQSEARAALELTAKFQEWQKDQLRDGLTRFHGTLVVSRWVGPGEDDYEEVGRIRR